MADDDNTNPPPEGTAPPAAASFSEADVAAILEADRKSRAPSPPTGGGDDPISRFRTSSSGTKLYADKSTPKPADAPRPGGSRIESLVESMLAVQLASMKPPAPPTPPKVLTPREKLAANDPAVFTSTNGANSWSKADTDALAREHASELGRQGYRGNIEEEARRRATRDVVAAGSEALRNIKVTL